MYSDLEESELEQTTQTRYLSVMQAQLNSRILYRKRTRCTRVTTSSPLSSQSLKQFLTLSKIGSSYLITVRGSEPSPTSQTAHVADQISVARVDGGGPFRKREIWMLGQLASEGWLLWIHFERSIERRLAG